MPPSAWLSCGRYISRISRGKRVITTRGKYAGAHQCVSGDMKVDMDRTETDIYDNYLYVSHLDTPTSTSLAPNSRNRCAFGWEVDAPPNPSRGTLFHPSLSLRIFPVDYSNNHNLFALLTSVRRLDNENLIALQHISWPRVSLCECTYAITRGNERRPCGSRSFYI